MRIARGFSVILCSLFLASCIAEKAMSPIARPAAANLEARRQATLNGIRALEFLLSPAGFASMKEASPALQARRRERAVADLAFTERSAQQSSGDYAMIVLQRPTSPEEARTRAGVDHLDALKAAATREVAGVGHGRSITIVVDVPKFTDRKP